MSGDQAARVVFVHGAFGGPWCWDATTEALATRGIESVSIDLPTIGESVDPTLDFHADAARVREILDGLDGPVVLCGNSYGGVVITEASAGAQNVVRLVYLAAFMLDEQDEVPGALVANCTPEFLGGFAFGDNGPRRSIATPPRTLSSTKRRPTLPRQPSTDSDRWLSASGVPLLSLQQAGATSLPPTSYAATTARSSPTHRDGGRRSGLRSRSNCRPTTLPTSLGHKR